MSNILRTKALFLTLFLATCAHQELKSPCHDAKLAAVLLALAPFFILLYLFNGTKSLFEGWLRQILTFTYRHTEARHASHSAACI